MQQDRQGGHSQSWLLTISGRHSNGQITTRCCNIIIIIYSPSAQQPSLLQIRKGPCLKLHCIALGCIVGGWQPWPEMCSFVKLTNLAFSAIYMPLGRYWSIVIYFDPSLPQLLSLAHRNPSSYPCMYGDFKGPKSRRMLCCPYCHQFWFFMNGHSVGLQSLFNFQKFGK